MIHTKKRLVEGLATVSSQCLRPANGLAAGEGMHDSDTDEAPQHPHGINDGLLNGSSHDGGAAGEAGRVAITSPFMPPPPAHVTIQLCRWSSHARLLVQGRPGARGTATASRRPWGRRCCRAGRCWTPTAPCAPPGLLWTDIATLIPGLTPAKPVWHTRTVSQEHRLKQPNCTQILKIRQTFTPAGSDHFLPSAGATHHWCVRATAGGSASAATWTWCKSAAGTPQVLLLPFAVHHGFTVMCVGRQTQQMEPVIGCAGPSGAVAGASAAAPSQPRNNATGPATTSAAGAAAAANDAEHSATRIRMYEAAGRGPGAGDSQGRPSPATPESPAFFPAPGAAAGASEVLPQGGRLAAALPAGWLSRTHQQPAAIGMQGAESPQLSQLPPWMAPSQQLVSAHVGCNCLHTTSSQRLSHLLLLAQITMKQNGVADTGSLLPQGASAMMQPQQPGLRQGSPKRGSGARSPQGSGSPAGGDRRKRERTGGSAGMCRDAGFTKPST
jgi:hypothetical protein